MQPTILDAPAPTTLATGLQLPEGPIAMPDGSVLVCEIRRGTLARVRPDGSVEVVSEVGGGPNGAALGPDGTVYIANNGGSDPETYEGGWIERVDLATGERTVLYTECNSLRLHHPNDLVFDRHGGFWFTDTGKRREFDMDLGGLFYAMADGSSIVRVSGLLISANGVGIAPDESRVYVAETRTGRLLAFAVEAPGRAPAEPDVVAATKERWDSLALEADGRIAVAALPGGVCSVSPDGNTIERLPLDDALTTNVCFGGADLQTAYITCAEKGTLVTTRWPRPGLRLEYQELPTG